MDYDTEYLLMSFKLAYKCLFDAKYFLLKFTIFNAGNRQNPIPRLYLTAFLFIMRLISTYTFIETIMILFVMNIQI